MLDRFPAELRANIGIHTCTGGDRDSVPSADVAYSNLLSSIFDLNAGHFLIQLASERDKDPVHKMTGGEGGDDTNGVPQMCCIGVTDPDNPGFESVEET